MQGKWIVTGANGYLGGEICAALSKSGETVCALSRAGAAPGGRTPEALFWYSYDALPDILAPGDVMVHCAAKVCETGLWEDYVAVNIEWTTSLFDRATSAGVSCFVYISSIAALGYSNRTGDAPLDESSDSLLLTGELYGRSKLLAEQALTERAQAAATRLIILRPGLVYGCGRIASTSHWLRRGVVVDPRQRVPLIHVDNFLDALVLCVKSESARGIYLAVDDEQPELRDLNRLKLKHRILRYRPWRMNRRIFKSLLQVKGLFGAWRRGRSLPDGYIEAQYAVRVRRLVYSTSRLRHDTGWAPKLSLEAGLEKSVRKYTESVERPT